MLNFRKLRQDFSSNILKEGKEIFDKGSVQVAKILHIDGDTLKLSSSVKGAYENKYECEVEINRNESIAVDSNCDCTYTYDCQHIAALLYHLEENLNQIVVAYSKETDLEACEKIDDKSKKELKATFKEAATKEEKRKGLAYQKEILHEYIASAKVLGNSPFFLKKEILDEDRADLAIIFVPPQEAQESKNLIEVQLALRLPFRSKPLYVPNVKAFLDSVRYREPVTIGGKKFFFTINSFEMQPKTILEMIMHHARFFGGTEERYLRALQIDQEAFGAILARAFDFATESSAHIGEKEISLPSLFNGNLEEPLCFSTFPSGIQFTIDYLEEPAPMLLLQPSMVVEDEKVPSKEVVLFESAKPGLIYKNTYYRFQPQIKRVHLKNLSAIENMTIPEPLFGTFIENALPTLRTYATVTNPQMIKQFVTLPFAGELKGRCEISYLNGELEAKFFFLYNKLEVSASFASLTYNKIALFSSGKEGVLARNLVEEREMLEEIFSDFLYDEKEGVYRIKSEKKIVEFMTEVIPKHSGRIKFECPENLSDQFLYDDTTFELNLRESDHIDSFEVELKVDGGLKGTSLDLLWDCLSSKKRFLELAAPKRDDKKVKNRIPRILVLDLEKMNPLVQLFDEMGIKKLDNHKELRPLWNLTTVNAAQFKSLPVKFSMSARLGEIQKQILGESQIPSRKIPEIVQATLRNYQIEGVKWLERLRRMHLSGILADDMGLGKTLQAIIALTQNKEDNPEAQALVVCPTSLVYNWKEELYKFNPSLRAVVVDNIPSQRRKMLKEVGGYDVLITSYNLLQKDVEIYKGFKFDYMILDEAQHIKNRTTRNAKSVKQINAAHRLILTGTPIENSLEELWSLFDFLMPGLLSSYDRFVEKYIRAAQTGQKSDHLEALKRKVSPFILRRMKEDVLDDLPPISEVFYHCSLTDMQRELYNSYAQSAKEELSKLVKKEGFEKIQIHVLATLTRLKQICCHPAIFAKEKPEVGDSAKYDMLMELIPSLIEGKHKTVIFSQYTKMLTILRDDLKSLGIHFSYLDGSSKNRVELVKQFNEDPSIPLFLVSLKAGGVGLNLTGADTVIHYDMWWNPAVENQATDRVHRIGQKKSVSSYKLITLNTIEEKIQQLHNRKKGLVKKVISSDEEAISKLTWEEVLELLQT